MKTDKIHFHPGLFLLFLIFPFISSCRHTANIDNIPVICFEKDVLPVFQNNCAIPGCHDGTREGRAFNTYTSIRRQVTPGKPYSSQLYQAIIGSGGNRMPPSSPLSLENRTIISVWIEQGANLTTCNDTTTTGGGGGGGTVGTLRACYTRDIQPILSSHCAMTGCHDISTHTDYVFYSYSSTMGAVSPGNPNSSKLYQVLHASGEEKMPPLSKPQLTTAQIDSIRNWISYGALDQTCAITCDTINPVTFSGTIWPIMQSSCTGCHGGAGGFTFSGYTDVSSLAASGTLMNAITGNGVPRMPPGGPFTTCQIRQFQIWVNNGHLNN